MAGNCPGNGDQPNGAAQPARVAVLIPCLNEAAAIGNVVADFRRELPNAEIYVYDNGSTDATADAARTAGAIVRREPRRGKGTVVQRMFGEIRADAYVIVDGDGTYPASSVHALLAPVMAGEADMVVGSRLTADPSHFKKMNLFGNRLFAGVVNLAFSVNLTDILSGYRALSPRLIRSVPLFERGFGIETELTIKTLQRNLRVVEIPTPLGERAAGTVSKINIVGDGLQIAMTIAALFRDYKPLTLFGLSAIALWFLAVVASGLTLSRGGTIETMLPGLLLAATFGGLGLGSAILGISLHTIDRRFSEMEYLHGIDRD